VARPVLPSTTTFSIFVVDAGLDPSAHVSGFSVDEQVATVLSVHLGGFPAGVDLSAQNAGALLSLHVGILPSLHIDGPFSSDFFWVDPSDAVLTSFFDVPSAGALPSAQTAGLLPSEHVGLLASLHLGGVPVAVVLSLHVAGGFLSEQDGGLPSAHLSGPSSVFDWVLPPDENFASSLVVVLP
jgi:hypothetical protein